MRSVHWLALACLCLLSGSRWLLADLLATGLPGQAVHFAVLAVIFALLSRKLPRQPGKIAFLSVLLLALPAAAFALAAGHVTPTTQTLIFTLVPAVVVVSTQQAQAFGPDSGTHALLLPSLVGVFGAMLLLPATLPAAIPNQLRLGLVVAAMLVSSLAAVALHRALAGQLLPPVATVAAAACAVVLGLLGARGPLVLLPRDAVITLLLDAPTLLLTLYLLRDLHPIRISTRFLLIPLVTILEGLVLLRPPLTVTLSAGLLLMLFAAIALLRYKPTETI